VRFLPLLLLALPAAAQTLHEPVSVGVLRCSGGVCVASDKHGGGGIRAFEEDGQVIHEPGGSPDANPGEQIFTPQPGAPVEVGGGSGGAGGGGDAPPDRRDIIHTDRDTGPEGPEAHVYHLVFNPEPYPFKRMTALDDVRIVPCRDGRPGCDDEVLVVHDQTRRQVGLAGPGTEPGRDLFWGSIVIDFEPGQLVPIPSVSADSMILQARTEPPVPVTFWRDGADNFFVMSPSGGRHRLVWLSDAPQSYFGGPLPNARLRDEPFELRRKLPAHLRERAQRVLDHIGVHINKNSSLKSVLDPLVEYFRAFEVGELPPAGDSSYCDIALNQKGCCRHRSYAFAITAMAVGIPVRYVENELHVYVEVYVPRLGPAGTGGWRRINLGGAALNEKLVGGDGKLRYVEKGGDPFPEPPAFTRGAEPPAGLPPPVGSAGAGGATAGGAGAGSGAGAKSGSGAGGGATAGSGASSGDGKHVDLAAIDARDAREAAQAGQPRRATTTISVEQLSGRSTFRGESVEVSGAVASGAGAAGLPVEIYLDGAHGAVRVGETTTDANGRWRATVEVPKELELGDHRVIARTRGDEKRGPSSSRAQ
jgi:hypothetical protein